VLEAPIYQDEEVHVVEQLANGHLYAANAGKAIVKMRLKN